MRANTWAFLVYPESEDIEEVKSYLDKKGFLFAVSPLHDKDKKDPKKKYDYPGEYKKSHYHVLLFLPGMRTYESVKKTLERFTCSVPVVMDCREKAFQYLTHENVPEKHQYNKEEVYYNCDEAVTRVKSEVETDAQAKQKKIALCKELIKIMKEGKFFEFFDLADFLVENDRDDLLELFMSKTYFFDRYLTSFRHYTHDTESRKISAERLNDVLQKRIDDLTDENKLLKEEINDEISTNQYLSDMWNKYLGYYGEDTTIIYTEDFTLKEVN